MVAFLLICPGSTIGQIVKPNDAPKPLSPAETSHRFTVPPAKQKGVRSLYFSLDSDMNAAEADAIRRSHQRTPARALAISQKDNMQRNMDESPYQL